MFLYVCSSAFGIWCVEEETAVTIFLKYVTNMFAMFTMKMIIAAFTKDY